MMKYDEEFFDAGLYRLGTRCSKWDLCRERHQSDVLPMWVADMDFRSPEAVREALLRRAAHPTYGYTEPLDDDYAALCDFWQRRHGVTFTREDVILLPCVVTGMKVCINALTQPGDGVMILTPLYGPFRMSIEATGRRLIDVELIHHADGRYEPDLAAMERRMDEGCRLLMLCSPHNPVGRCWTEAELRAMLELAQRHGIPVVCDEIHADFVYAPRRFVPMLSLAREGVVTMCAASKTFNLAGLQQASMICRDPALREKLQAQMLSSGVTAGNIFALEGTRAAYQEGDAWLDGLLSYLAGNVRELERCVKTYLPQAVLSPMEATYLGWLDLRAYGHTTAELERRAEAHGVVFTEGTFFGRETGEGFLRVNIGCPRAHIEEAIRRLAAAVEA